MRDININSLNNLNIKLHEYEVTNCELIVICVHGMAEHSMRYDALAKFLNLQKMSVYTYDHRGHGESLLENEKHGYLGKNGFDHLISDLDAVVSYVKQKHPTKKIFLLGHSMGSFVVQRYIQVHKKVSGVIFSGSSFKAFGMRFVRSLAWLICMFGNGKKQGHFMNKLTFGSYNKKFKPNRTDFDWLNRNEGEVDNYINDNYCGFVSTNQFYYDFINGLIQLQKQKNIASIKKNLPIYIISGDKDPVGENSKKVKQLYNAYKQVTKNIEMKLYKEARHEILLEENKEQVYQDILNWLEKNK